MKYKNLLILIIIFLLSHTTNGQNLRPLEKDVLNDISIWSILEGRNGNIWVGTRYTVLSLYDRNTFTNFSEID